MREIGYTLLWWFLLLILGSPLATAYIIISEDSRGHDFISALALVMGSFLVQSIFYPILFYSMITSIKKNNFYGNTRLWVISLAFAGICFSINYFLRFPMFIPDDSYLGILVVQNIIVFGLTLFMLHGYRIRRTS